MKETRIISIKSLKLQKGMTLIELLVAGVISLIAVSGMVIVMANTLGTATQTIEMTRLTHDMRTAMQIMTRELRRANYHPNWIACYGNTGCRSDLSIDGQINTIHIGDSASTNDCLWFWYDRPQLCPAATCTAEEFVAAQKPVTEDYVSAFRRVIRGGVGILQMTTTQTAGDTCSGGDNWVDITDPNIIDIRTFTVTNADPNRPSISEKLNPGGYTQNVEKIGLTMTAKLTADASVPAWMIGPTGFERELDEFVTVRNNITTAAP